MKYGKIEIGARTISQVRVLALPAENPSPVLCSKEVGLQ